MELLNTSVRCKYLFYSFLLFCLLSSCSISSNKNDVEFVSSSEGRIEKIIFAISPKKYYDTIEIKSIDSSFGSNRCLFIFDGKQVDTMLINNYMPSIQYQLHNINSIADFNNNIKKQVLYDYVNDSKNFNMRVLILNYNFQKLLPQNNFAIAEFPRNTDTTMRCYATHFHNIVDIFDFLKSKKTVYYTKFRGDDFLDSIFTDCGYSGYVEDTLKYNIDGGNYFLGKEYLLVGESIVKNNPNVNQEQLEHDLLKFFRKKYIIYSTSDTLHLTHSGMMKQPYYHIDIYITPLGNIGNKEYFLVGDIDPSYVFPNSKKETLFTMPNNNADILNTSLDQSCTYLEYDMEKAIDRDVCIIRVPIMYYGNQIFSFNNCIVENMGDSLTIFLPQYYKHQCDDPEYKESIWINKYSDSVIQKFYTELERSDIDIPFKIIPVKGNFIYKNRESSLHCMCKISDRSRGKR